MYPFVQLRLTALASDGANFDSCVGDNNEDFKEEILLARSARIRMRAHCKQPTWTIWSSFLIASAGGPRAASGRGEAGTSPLVTFEEARARYAGDQPSSTSRDPSDAASAIRTSVQRARTSATIRKTRKPGKKAHSGNRTASTSKVSSACLSIPGCPSTRI